MNPKQFCFAITCLSLLYNVDLLFVRYDNHDFIKVLMDHMKIKLQVKRITLLETKPNQYYTGASIKIIKALSSEFTVVKANLNDQNKMKKWSKMIGSPLRIPQSIEMLISLIDVHRDHRSINKEINRHVSFLDAFTAKAIPYPNWLLVLVNDRPISGVSSYFRYLWSLKILHLAIVEVIVTKIKKSSRQKSLGSIKYRSNVTLHKYNPFNQTHIKRFNFNKIDLFPDYLKNLYGLEIRASFQNSEYSVSFRKKVTKSLNDWDLGGYGGEVLIMSKIMNFTLVP